jgi:hypothetical protein
MIGYGIGCIRAAVAGALLLGFAGAAVAKDPSAAEIAVARKLIELKGVGGIYDPVFIGIIEKAKYTFLQSNPMLANDLNAVAAQLLKEFRPRLEQLKTDAAKLYAARFTEAELNQIYAFYTSPLGAKLIKVEPQVLDESMKEANQWAEKLADEVMAKMRSEMRKRGHEL